MLALSRPASLAARRSMSGQRVAGRKCQLSHSSRPAVAASAHASLLAQLASDVAESLPALSEEAQAAAKAAEQLAANKSGFLGGIANVLEGALESIDGVLSAAHVPYSYGFSIIVLTVFVKALTFPLSKKQIESTTAMQALQPRVKDLQARYASDQDRLQRETAKLYQEAGVNPLAGCLPTLATLPVFIGLYRALTNAASDGLLTEGWFWIPSLGGPSTMAENTSGRGLGWLFPLVDGHPPIGWHDALAYLLLPALLIVSQFASQKLMQPAAANADPSAASANAILKFLPFMVGWFSLNVPSGLTLYWLVNNVLTTAQTVYLRNAVASAAALPPPPSSTPAGMAGSGLAARGGGGLPPNPPPLTPASRAVVDVEAMAVSGSGGAGGAEAGGGAAPGSRFAQLKAQEKGKGGKKQIRPATGSAPKGVTWAAPDRDKPPQS